MSQFADALAYDMEHVVANPSEFGETLHYEHTSLPGGRLSVRAVVGEPEVLDGGQGVWVYQAQVFLLGADLTSLGAAVTVQTDGDLVRNPDGWPTGSEERWYIVSARPTAGGWRCLAQRPAR